MCFLFGLIDYGDVLNVKKKERIIKILSKECEARGTDATGVAYVYKDRIIVYKRPLPARKMNIYFKGNPTVIMGHTRLSTQGSEKINCNNHPFLSKNMDFSLFQFCPLPQNHLQLKNRYPNTCSEFFLQNKFLPLLTFHNYLRIIKVQERFIKAIVSLPKVDKLNF